MSAALLKLSGVTAYYGAIQALKGVDLEVNEGEIVTLIGANGAGKSTLMMTVCGNPRARDGSIVYDGTDITHLPTHEIMRKRIAQAPEGRRIFSRMSVHENLLMGAEVAANPDIPGTLESVFTLFPRLKERGGQRGGTLSGGEQQMLAIGRALMSRPRLLLLDEPSLGLAPLVVEDIFKTLQAINREGTTILLIEQNANLALSISHYVYVLSVGSIVLEGTPEAVKQEGQLLTAYLGGAG